MNYIKFYNPFFKDIYNGIHYLKSRYLLESFDLDAMYVKNNIPPIIRELSEKFINNWISGIKNIPTDVNTDKLILWYARNLKKYILDTERKEYDIEYKKYSANLEPELLSGVKSLKNRKNTIDYFNGQYDLYSNEEALKQIGNYTVWFEDMMSKYEMNIKDYIFSSVRNGNIWKINYQSTIKELYEISITWHKKLKASGSVTSEEGVRLIEYGNGFYWIDLQTKECTEEGEAMGHCGRTGANTILSLRERKKDGSIEPFVTVAIDYAQTPPWYYDGDVGRYLIDYNKIDYDTKEIYGKIYQNKGKGNDKPISKYHQYIIDLYINYSIGEKLGNEYMPDSDFELTDLQDENLIRRVFKEYPKLINHNDILFYENNSFTRIFFEEYPHTNNSLLMSNNYYLMEKGVITKEQFVNRFSKFFEIKDDIIYLKIKGDINDLSFMYDEKSAKIVNLITDYTEPFDNGYTYEDLYLGYFNNQAVEAIEEKIEEKIKEYNTSSELLEQYDTFDLRLRHIEDFYDIKMAVVEAYNSARESANNTQMYREVMYPLLRYLDMEKMEYYSEGLLLKLKKEWLINYDKYVSYVEDSVSFLNKKIAEDFIDSCFQKHGDSDEIDAIEDKFRVDVPQYGWDGRIDKEELYDYLVEKLSEI